jgi:hypothetical protein
MMLFLWFRKFVPVEMTTALLIGGRIFFQDKFV